jgi:carboxyl-terminal processing protease
MGWFHNDWRESADSGFEVIVASDVLAPAEMDSIFEKVVETFERKLYDPNLNGVNWRAVAGQRKADVLASRSGEEFESRVNDLIKELRVSHAGFYHESKPRAAGKIAISATLFRTDETPPRWVFQDVHPGGAAHRAGIQPGDIVLRVAEKKIVPPEMPLFPFGETTAVEVEQRDGSHARAMVEVPKSKTKKRPLIELEPVSFTRLDGDIGWLKVCMFPGAIGIDLAHDIDKAIKVLDCERLIIDLRGNTGGGIGCLRLMSYLTPGRLRVGYSVTRKRAENSFRKELLPVFSRIPDRKIGLLRLIFTFGLRDQSVCIATENLGPQPFHGRTVLLVNEHSASSSEMVAAFAAEHQLAAIVGTKTAGRLLAGHSVRVGHGYRVALPVAAYYTWDEKLLEGVGVAPDVEERFSVQAIREGRDVQLQTAIRVVRDL